jgi:peptidoglycan/LPS O-acetylase OafA/YrhL
MLADLSYLVYLLHWIAIMWLDSHRSSIFHRLFIVLAAWVLVMGLSFAIWKFYDHPINRLRSRWVRSRRMVAAGEAEQARAAQDGRAT